MAASEADSSLNSLRIVWINWEDREKFISFCKKLEVRRERRRGSAKHRAYFSSFNDVKRLFLIHVLIFLLVSMNKSVCISILTLWYPIVYMLRQHINRSIELCSSSEHSPLPTKSKSPAESRRDQSGNVCTCMMIVIDCQHFEIINYKIEYLKMIWIFFSHHRIRVDRMWR